MMDALSPTDRGVSESFNGQAMSEVSLTSSAKKDDGVSLPAQSLRALKRHWPEYLIEAAGLSVFMISACAFATLLFHPASPAPKIVANPFLQRMLMGAAMGLTAVAIIYSPWGKRSGAHINPAVTLTFYRLGKVEGWDALLYMLAQFAGGILGVLISIFFLGNLLADPSVNYVTTVPGENGLAVAFMAEAFISFILMMTVLVVSNTKRAAHLTGLAAGALVFIYISFESPLSGMSMNPARTVASAAPAHLWTALWLYFTAPPAGMFLAAELYSRVKGRSAVACAKLHHRNNERCIFHCNYQKD